MLGRRIAAAVSVAGADLEANDGYFSGLGEEESGAGDWRSYDYNKQDMERTQQTTGKPM
jgi:hypothetical protein